MDYYSHPAITLPSGLHDILKSEGSVGVEIRLGEEIKINVGPEYPRENASRNTPRVISATSRRSTGLAQAFVGRLGTAG
jgi:hypothetical protein